MGRGAVNGHVAVALDNLSVCGADSVILGEMPVAVHRVEVELRRVDDEVVVEVIGAWHGFEESASPVLRNLDEPSIPDTCPRLCFLRRELHGHAVMRRGFDVRPGRADDAMVIAGRQGVFDQQNAV